MSWNGGDEKTVTYTTGTNLYLTSEDPAQSGYSLWTRSISDSLWMTTIEYQSSSNTWTQNVDVKTGVWTQSLYINNVLIWIDTWDMKTTEWDLTWPIVLLSAVESESEGVMVRVARIALPTVVLSLLVLAFFSCYKKTNIWSAERDDHYRRPLIETA